MKKKEAINKPVKGKPVEINHKKSLAKPKLRSKEISSEQPDIFVLVGDNFYAASTKSERKSYEKFQNKLKTSTSSLKKIKSRSINHYQEPINLQQYVKKLTKEEKEKLLRDLSKQIDPQPPKEFTEEEERYQKMQRLTEKLESLRQELTIRWDDQIKKINHTFQNEDISLEEKNEKIALIQKIKENKIAMINHTQLLFQKIFKEEPEIELEKSQRMENIINSLNSISSLDPRDHLHQQEHRNILQQISIINNQPSVRMPPLFDEIVQIENKEKQLHLNIANNIISINESVKIQDFPKKNVLSKQSLKLDLRLDDVQFGRDHYDDDQVSENISPTKQQQKERQIIKLEFFKGEPEIEKKQSNPDDEFLCVGEQSHQIHIPLLMTKDKIEELKLQKSAKEIEGLVAGIKQRQQFQLNEIHTVNNHHFTTLLDINEFVQRFYEFLIRNYSRQIIQGLNSPYGKSCLDKLECLRKQGIAPEYENRNILPEQFLDRYYYELKQAGCQVKEEEKIYNKAIFHVFNTQLNVYRPYYQLDGEIFSWNISEKGLNFYEINDQNLSQVFQKGKGKVLEYSASLCGLMPVCELTTEQAKALLRKKNQEQIQRVVCSEMIQHFGKWSISIVNFEASQRLALCEQIISKEIESFCQQIRKLKIKQ